VNITSTRSPNAATCGGIGVRAKVGGVLVAEAELGAYLATE
jgi:hypothetical protein